MRIKEFSLLIIFELFQGWDEVITYPNFVCNDLNLPVCSSKSITNIKTCLIVNLYLYFVITVIRFGMCIKHTMNHEFESSNFVISPKLTI